jgi:SAM-dependent methyltransferase
MMGVESDRDDRLYRHQDRCDRTRPGRLDPYYRHLILLRDRLREIVESPLLPAGEKLLDYGCGSKPYKELFAAKFRQHVGADLPGNAHADIVVGPDGRLPVDDNTYDCVLSTQVLVHIEDPRLYLSEAYRVLKPGGSLILSTNGIWKYVPDPVDYWRWTIEGLQLEIRRAGFEIVTVKGVFGLTSSALQLWQDATWGCLPRLLRPIYGWLLQSIIGLIERRNRNRLSSNASVYVVLARKPESRGRDDTLFA